MCSVKCLGKVALNDIKPSEDSNNKATEEKIKKNIWELLSFSLTSNSKLCMGS